MAKAIISDDEFIDLFRQIGPEKMSSRLQISARSVFGRRKRLEQKYGHTINPPEKNIFPGKGRPIYSQESKAHPGRIDISVKDGVVLIGSDAHYWPGEASTAHRAFVKFCRDLKPIVVIKNGDLMDGASISRHPPIGWDNQPTVVEEIEAVKDRLGEITVAAGKARRFWPLGNHDARYETRLATVAPEYAEVHGISLKDHFPDWEPCWSVAINSDVIVKHRFKGGIHATHNNTLWAGKTMVTGHLHSLKVTPLTDYNGTRFGIDTGCLADPWGPQFEYLEDNPRNWRSGFAVLTFYEGRLLWPETCHVLDKDTVEFRGKVLKV